MESPLCATLLPLVRLTPDLRGVPGVLVTLVVAGRPPHLIVAAHKEDNDRQLRTSSAYWLFMTKNGGCEVQTTW